MLHTFPLSRYFAVAVVPAIALAAPALAQVSTTGAVFQSAPNDEQGGRLIVGFEGVGSATISGDVVLESSLEPPSPDDPAAIIASAPSFNVGEQDGGIGSAVVEGENASVVLLGNDNTANVMVGNRGGIGTLVLRDGALVSTRDEAATAATGPGFANAIFVGSRGGTGTFEVDGASAEVVSTFGAFMFIGNLGGTGNAVFRNGASLAITEIASDEEGNDGNGASIIVGRAGADEGDGGGTGSLTVDGSTVSVSSANASAQLVVGREEGTLGTVQLTGGAQVDLTGEQASVQIGRDAGAQGVLTMDEGSVLTLSGTQSPSVQVGAAFPDFGRDEGGSGTLLLSGAGTRLETSGNVIIGAPTAFGDGTGSGMVSVSQGATLQAERVFVGTGGVLTGNSGFIDANVTLDGGVIAPGASPGSMSVFGNFDAFSGIFDFEFAGSTPGLFDTLDIFGDLMIGNDVTFRFSFLDGFLPAASTEFNFLNVKGDVFGELSNVMFEGIEDSFGLSLFSKDGSFVLAQSASFPGENGDTVAPIPLPASVLLLATGVAGLAALRRRRSPLA